MLRRLLCRFVGRGLVTVLLVSGGTVLAQSADSDAQTSTRPVRSPMKISARCSSIIESCSRDVYPVMQDFANGCERRFTMEIRRLRIKRCGHRP